MDGRQHRISGRSNSCSAELPGQAVKLRGAVPYSSARVCALYGPFDQSLCAKAAREHGDKRLFFLHLMAGWDAPMLGGTRNDTIQLMS